MCASPHPARAEEFQPPFTSGRCQVAVELMAVVYNYKRPERSFAMVVSGRDPGRVVGVGSTVVGLVVLAVTPRRLWLNADPAPCFLPLSHQDDRKVEPPKRPAKKKKRKRRKRRRRKKRR